MVTYYIWRIYRPMTTNIQFSTDADLYFLLLNLFLHDPCHDFTIIYPYFFIKIYR